MIGSMDTWRLYRWRIAVLDRIIQLKTLTQGKDFTALVWYNELFMIEHPLYNSVI